MAGNDRADDWLVKIATESAKWLDSVPVTVIHENFSHLNFRTLSDESFRDKKVKVKLRA